VKQTEALRVLKKWDKKGKYVFTIQDLRKLFPTDKPRAFMMGIDRLVKETILVRACREIYVNRDAMAFDGYTIEHIAKALRRGEYNYVSLESILSEYGVISQIPLDRLTVMTTGRSGTYKTPFGMIEYTHTKRPIANILQGILSVENRPLRIATKQTAWRDLKRVGRNINLVNLEELHD
jgi:hypothetical protein